MSANSDMLKEHYEDKYKGEASKNIGPEDYLRPRWPRNRFEACVHWNNGGKRILDIGCGDGAVLYSLREKFEELNGLDLSEARIEGCRRAFASLGNKSHFVVANAEERLPYTDNYFDCIINSAVIEHMVDVYGCFKEMHRVLNVGGTLCINTPNIAKWTRRLKLLFGYYPATASKDEGLTNYDGIRSTTLLDEGHFNNFTYRLMRKILIRNGFSEMVQYGFGPFGRVHNIWPELLSDDVVILAKRTSQSI